MEWRRPRIPRGIDPRLTDAVVAVALFVVLVLSFGATPGAAQRPADIWAWLLALLLTAPYAVHRRYPWAALAVALTALLAFSLLHYAAFPGVSVFVLLLGLALHGGRRDSLVAFGATVAAFVVALAAQPAGVVTPNDVVSTLLATTVAWLAGDNLRQRRLRWAAMEERTRLLEREREDRARAAVAAERLRIARELHDIVAHHITGMVIQAQAAQIVARRDPANAAEPLAGIETAGTEALAAMRRVVGLLRDTADAAPASPGPERLDELVERFSAGGPRATLRSCGGADWPPEVTSTVYRVVREALTNVRRHAPQAGSVAVTVAEEPEGVTVRVDDDAPPGPARPHHRAGYGLVGMRERVETLGGTLAAGPRPGGGWSVRAVLPLRESR